MSKHTVRAAFMRGGTSKGVMLHARDLPDDPVARDAILCAMMGSPDAYGRQLDGMGGGVSSLSKICLIAPPSVPGADVDYTFGQVIVREARVDYTGNCGNMSAAVGPFAVRSGLVDAPHDGETAVRIHNTNSGKIIRAVFAMHDGDPAESGELAIDGVSGSGAPIRLEFLQPGGAATGSFFPSQARREFLVDDNGKQIDATLIDAATPCVFLPASAFGLHGAELPSEIENRPGLMHLLEALRRQASVRMGLAEDDRTAARKGSVPKVAIVAQTQTHRTLSGQELVAGSHDLVVRMVSMGNVHLALPVTGSVCLAAALRTAGTLPANLAGAIGSRRTLCIAHPSGTIEVDADVHETPEGIPVVSSASVLRTARLLFDGSIHYHLP